MRVISGIYKSRKLNGYGEITIRPTMDKVKESIFAMINNYIENSICLDLFGGTGALGIEAFSNGADSVTIVDNSNVAINIINENLKSLSITKIDVIKNSFTSALNNFSNNAKTFDIIFVDPPYGVIKISKVLKEIVKYNVLSDNGIVVCEYEDEELSDDYDNLHLLKSRSYGKTNVKIYINRK